MTANTTTTQLLVDTGQTTVVKFTGFFNAASPVSEDKVVLKANTLAWANANASSNVCTLSISKLQYSSDVTGTVQLYWVGTTNSEIMTFGTSQSGEFDCYIPNNAVAPTGEIGVKVIGAANNDNFNFVLTINKEKGFDRAFVAYNDNTFVPA